MISTGDLVGAFARNVGIVKAQSEGLTHAESLMQLPFQGNCLNWVIGHVISNRGEILELLGEPPMMADDTKHYLRGSEPLTGEGPGVLPLEDLLARLDQMQEHLATVLGQMDEADMARELTLSNGRKATLGQRVFFMYFHEVYHVGQTELLRQLTGKNDKVI